MKYKVKDYAKALAEILADKKADEKKVVEGFIKLLQKEGLQNKASQIIGEAEILHAKKQGKKEVVLETARKLTDSQKKMLGKFIENGDIVKEKINPALIAGIKIIVNGNEQFDMSMANKISKIFKQ